MRRYLYGDSIDKLERIKYDVLIVGSGVAGLYAGLHLSPSLKCALITKSALSDCNSYLAQGGIASVIAPDDRFEYHIEDTLTAGAGMCDLDAVKTLVSEGPENIRELVRLGVPFDLDDDGELQITREGGHHRRRIVHCGGDATGRETTKRLGQLILTHDNVKVMTQTYLVDILTDEGRVVGAVVCENGVYRLLITERIILASGGIGHLYNYTTNPSGAIGDGIAAASRVGAEVINMEMVQFHPTTMIPHSNSDHLFLISEAVRGEGGILRNREGFAFMKDLHPLADLAPRDIVTRCILSELKRSGDTNVFLDVSSMSTEFFSKRFPTIFAECRSFGIDVPNASIPVRPAQHYLMGGIKTNIDAQTNISGLYACGETACTGIHGANRLASNSLLECLVFGRRAAININNSVTTNTAYALPTPEAAALKPLSDERVSTLETLIRDTMTEQLGAVRTHNGMERANKLLRDICDELEGAALSRPEHYSLFNMAQNAAKISSDAINRRESIGAHYIEE